MLDEVLNWFSGQRFTPRFNNKNCTIHQDRNSSLAMALVTRLSYSYTTPNFIRPDWLPLPTLASSSESKSKADSIIVVSCNNLSLDADKGVVTVTAGMEDVSRAEETTALWRGSGAISSISIGAILRDASGISLVTSWLILFVVLPRSKNPHLRSTVSLIIIYVRVDDSYKVHIPTLRYKSLLLRGKQAVVKISLVSKKKKQT